MGDMGSGMMRRIEEKRENKNEGVVTPELNWQR